MSNRRATATFWRVLALLATDWRSFSILALAIPNFWLGMILIAWLSVGLGVLPSFGASGPASLVIPTIALAARLIALLARMTRGVVIEELRKRAPNTTIEILTPDFRGKMKPAIKAICEARPDVFNHNLETVPRLYPTIRPGARYYASLRLLEEVKANDPSIFTKSGIMLGLGEQRLEIHQVMDDMRSADIDFLTMGQYLQPTPKHAKVVDFVTPQQFSALGSIARAKGFLQVASSPLTRSSYHAGDDFAEMKAAREAQLAKQGSEPVKVPGKKQWVRDETASAE